MNQNINSTNYFDGQPDPESREIGQPGNEQARVIPVIEEQVLIGKKVVESGRVRISKHVSEEKITVNVPVVHEEVEVEKVSVNQFVESAPEVRYEGETMIIPVIREVVEVRLLLVEELHVTKRRVETQHSEEVTLRKEELTVERVQNDSVRPDSV
jgi:uncharacterized protein (TIGR02271 family)